MKAAAALFSEVAAKVMKDAREAKNSRLNAGSRVREYALGDIVSIYCPKSATNSEWKPKHVVHGGVRWR